MPTCEGTRVAADHRFEGGLGWGRGCHLIQGIVGGPSFILTDPGLRVPGDRRADGQEASGTSGPIL
jgi:hypothetical protein